MSELHTKTDPDSLPNHAAAASSPDFAFVTQPFYAQTLFLGPDGLRPGWGLAFYVALFFTLIVGSVVSTLAGVVGAALFGKPSSRTRTV